MARSFNGGNRRLNCIWNILFGTAWLAASGCGADDSAFSASKGDNGADESGPFGPAAAYGGVGNQGNSSGADYDSGGSSAVVTLPKEQEVIVKFDLPQSSLNYVYAANPDRDSVAVIHASNLAIQVVETGDQPRFLRTIPGRDAALLVDVGASDIAYIETAAGKSSVSYYQDLPSANVIEVAPDGRHAVAYFDIANAQQGNFETLQDVSVMSFGDGPPAATRMTVGFKPRKITFAGGETGAANAYVVTQDGISILDLAKIDLEGKPGIADLVSVYDSTDSANGADISVTPDGSHAIGRLEGATTLRLVELATKKAQDLDLAILLNASVVTDPGTSEQATGGATAQTETPSAAGRAGAGMAGAAGADDGSGGSGTGGTTATTAARVPAADITDLDLAPNGKFALAVSRSRGVLMRVPIPQAFDDPSLVTMTDISDVTVGAAAISPNGNWAVLYTTVVESERRIVIVDLTGNVEPRIVDLTKSIQGITFSSSGDQAYVAHNKVAGSPTDPGLSDLAKIDRSYGYTLVDLKLAFRKLVLAKAEPDISLAIPNEPYVFLTFKNSSTEVQRLDMTSLQVNSIELGSVPISLGAVSAAKRVFVSQNHDAGRLTFIDWDDLTTQTVTGYELNSKIRE